MKFFLPCCFFILSTAGAFAGETADSSKKWIALHLTHYDSDQALEKLEETIPSLASKGLNLIFLEVNYSFDFRSHPELRRYEPFLYGKGLSLLSIWALAFLVCLFVWRQNRKAIFVLVPFLLVIVGAIAFILSCNSSSKRIISHEGAARFTAFCKGHGIRVVPQFQVMGHQSFQKETYPLLIEYPELDLTPGYYPNNEGIYCREWNPYHPKVNKIIFPMIDEIIEAFGADGLHLGMGEIRLIQDQQAFATKSKEPSEVFAMVVNQYHDYFAKQKGKQLFIWGDRLIDGKKFKYGGWEASLSGTAAAVDSIPTDIVVCDWHRQVMETYASIPMFLDKGFKVLPCSSNNIKCTEALIKYTYLLDHPRMMGHLFAPWAKAKYDSLLRHPAIQEGLDMIRQRRYYDPVILSSTVPGDDHIQFMISSAYPNYSIHYTTDGSEPSVTSPVYLHRIKAGGHGALTVKAALFNGNQPAGHSVEKKVIVHKAIGKALIMQTVPSPKYASKDGVETINNGLLGSSAYTDGEWVGYEGEDMVLAIDLGKVTDLSSVSFNSLNDTYNWIHQADKINLMQSIDGKVYLPIAFQTIPLSEEAIVKTTVLLAVKTRFLLVKISCKTIAKGFPGEGNKAWLFVDEIILE